MAATADGSLSNINLEIDDNTAATVVMVSGGYPDEYEKGIPINGLDVSIKNTLVFHAGTKSENGNVITNGGRVFATTGLGDTMQKALNAAYATVESIDWEGKNYRKDIGFDL